MEWQISNGRRNNFERDKRKYNSTSGKLNNADIPFYFKITLRKVKNTLVAWSSLKDLAVNKLSAAEIIRSSLPQK